MAVFTDNLRYRLACRVTKFSVSVLTTNPVEFAFPDGLTSRVEFAFPDILTFAVPLLEKQDTYHLAFLLIPEKTVSATDLIFDFPTVSENHFEPLGKCTTGGKNYVRSKNSYERGLFPNQKHDEDLNTSSSWNFDSTPDKGADIWDILLPILEPPMVDFDSDGELIVLPAREELYGYQVEGIEFLLEHKEALLGDDMGTGKTVQSIVACHTLYHNNRIRKSLVLAPLSILAQWEQEIERWAPSLRVVTVRGPAELRKVRWSAMATNDQKYHICLTTYDMLRRDIDHLVHTNNHEFDLVILDEAQKIKNRSSGMSKAVRKLVGEYRWALTGTPLENSVSDLVSIFAFLKPGVLPGDKISPGYARELIKHYFLRRRLEDVRDDIPEKTESPFWLSLEDAQQRTYDEMERKRVVELHQKGEKITAPHIFALIDKLKQICNRDPVTGASVKLDWLREKIPSICEAGNKILIFTQYQKSKIGGAQWLAQELAEFGPLNYEGGATERRRDEILRQFEGDPEKRIFLGHPRTAGLGLNQLVVANYVVHFDHWWNPSTTKQATARAFRPTKEKGKKVFVHHLWVKNTIEDLVLQKTKEKQDLFGQVIDSLSASGRPTEDALFGIYGALLAKHGLELQSSKSNDKKQTPPEKYGGPREFEKLVSRLFKAMGYRTTLTPSSRDGGVDVIASRGSGTAIEKLAIQCKLQSTPVGRPVFQNLKGVLAEDSTYSGGVVVTDSNASRDAHRLLERDGNLRVIDGKNLERLLSKHGVS